MPPYATPRTPGAFVTPSLRPGYALVTPWWPWVPSAKEECTPATPLRERSAQWSQTSLTSSLLPHYALVTSWSWRSAHRRPLQERSAQWHQTSLTPRSSIRHGPDSPRLPAPRTPHVFLRRAPEFPTPSRTSLRTPDQQPYPHQHQVPPTSGCSITAQFSGPAHGRMLHT